MTRLLYKISTRAFLLLAVLLAMVPFLDIRVLRMAGDEKVYLTQAIEMARDGRWFVQTLADEPSYFKGPLHYLLIRIGMLVFGNHLIAGVWMNCAIALLAGLAMYRLGRRRWSDKSGLLLGLATALNVGMFSHAVVSQMEVEVAAFYAFATAALGLSRRKPDFKYDLLFWLAAGVAGWIKSPVHSVFIAAGGVLYWALTRQLWTRAKTPQAWAAALIGVGVGFLGYVPAMAGDWKNFYETYILREQFQKGTNARTWDYVTVPLVYYTLPWTFVLIAALRKMFNKWRSIAPTVDLPMVKLGLSMSMPTIIFWCVWSYKGQNYNLPAIPALYLFGWACFNGNIPRWSSFSAGILGFLASAFAIGVLAHFWPLPEWWGMGWLVLAFGAMLGFSAIFVLADDVRALGVGTVLFFISFGAFISPLGEREMLDMRQYLKDYPDTTYHYYNLELPTNDQASPLGAPRSNDQASPLGAPRSNDQASPLGAPRNNNEKSAAGARSIWSEWSILQLTLHHTIYGLHRENQLDEAIQPGHAIIAKEIDWLHYIEAYWKNSKSPTKGLSYEITPWTRWLTKGHAQDGKNRWKMAWETADLRNLEREYYIIRFK